MSRELSGSGKSTDGNDMLKRVLDLFFVKNTNGNLRLVPNDGTRRECPVQLPAGAAISAIVLPCENTWNS